MDAPQPAINNQPTPVPPGKGQTKQQMLLYGARGKDATQQDKPMAVQLDPSGAIFVTITNLINAPRWLGTLADDPASANEGDQYYKSGANMRVYTSGAWRDA